MKRIGNIFGKVCSLENLHLADSIARKGKRKQRCIRQHDKNREANLHDLQKSLLNKTYRTSEYTIFTIYEPKERQIFRLPYKDRIVHHGIMNILEPVFTSMYTADSYSCIKRRGVHKASNAVKKALKDNAGTQFCLKLDIRKFYPSIDHTILKELLRRKIKDVDLLHLVDGIIDSAIGLPIGNYLSQHLANFYLTGFDHWLKEQKKVKYYFRYADDIVILSDNKAYLHTLLAEIKEYLEYGLHISVKHNYQIFPVAARGIDFVGYVHYHTHTLLRKGIKKRMARMYAQKHKPQSAAAYNGWAKHGNCINLLKKLHNESNKHTTKEVQRI